jgi:2-polyprenyl-6-methoxyphenol hydroxylase-like FAD-dependent oxidoreductase
MREHTSPIDTTARRGVLIVGAGPTGLTLANDLARRGVPFRLVDAKSGVTADSKGLALNVGSLYAYRLLGLGERVGAVANRIRRLGIWWNARRFSRIDFHRLACDVRALRTQPQSRTEAELLAALEEAGGRVDWSHALLDARERDDEVQVRLSLPDGRVVEESYRYLVGCDGKHSVVRRSLGAGFAGSDYDMHFVLGDFHLDVDWSEDEVQYRVHDDGFFILVPLGAGLWRIVVKYDGQPPAGKPSAADITGAVARRLGPGIVAGEPVWLSRAPFYYRVADRLCSRRLFIAGDAAHLFSPIGGTGMNTGIQDAVNLGWKLALHWHGHAGAGILQTYEAERLPLIRQAAAVADLSTRLIGGADRHHPVIAGMAPVLANRRALRHVFPVTHSGMGVRVAVPDSAGATAGTLNAPFLESVVPCLLQGGANGWRNAFHCIVRLPEAHDAAAHVHLARLRAQVAHVPLVQLAYLAGAGALGPPGAPLGTGERLVVLEADRMRRLDALPAWMLVRPDGITIGEGRWCDHVDIDALLLPYLQSTADLAIKTALS